jgi:hypothetical protein
VVSVPHRVAPLHPLDVSRMRPLIRSRPTRETNLCMQRAAHPVRATNTFPLACSSMSKTYCAYQLCPLTLAVQSPLRNRDLMATLRTGNSETHRQYITAGYVMRTRVQHVPVRDKLPRREDLPPGRTPSLKQPAKLGLESAFPELLDRTPGHSVGQGNETKQDLVFVRPLKHDNAIDARNQVRNAGTSQSDNGTLSRFEKESILSGQAACAHLQKRLAK